MIVVDLGCYPHGREVSIEPLIYRFQPTTLFGFDPYPGLREENKLVSGRLIGTGMKVMTKVILSRKAAWVRDGTVTFAAVEGERSYDSTVMREKAGHGEWDGDLAEVPCFDLCAFIEEHADKGSHEMVVKFDVEGAEFPLLEAMHERGVDKLVDLILVEWHDHKMGGDFVLRRSILEAKLRTKVQEW